MSRKFILFLYLILICIFTVSCGDNVSKVNNGEGKEEASGDIPEGDEPSEDSDAENDDAEISDSEISDETQESDDNGNENGEENGNETQDSSDETGDEDSKEPWHEESAVVDASDDFEAKTEALIVTTGEFAEVFQKFADFHTVTGINTKVVTVEEICSSTICDDTNHLVDTQKAIKDYVMSVEGLKYLIIGGDIEDVPSRLVHDEFSITFIADYKDDFYSDFYYADFSDWDLNGNGVYAEDDDVPGLVANVAVGRISVSTVDEAEIYFEKIVRHHTAFDTGYTKKSLLIANVATKVSGVDINAGYYFEAEGKTASIISSSSDYEIARLYTEASSQLLSPSNESKPLNNDSEKAAIESGKNLVIHSGHGSPKLLTCEQGIAPEQDFDRDMAYGLKNKVLPVFLSCACEAGQFGYKYGDSAGEKLMNAPEGGAIVYLGNTTTGLGIAGGSQFIDEMLKNMFAFPYSTIGESYLYAHVTMPKNDTFNPPVVNLNVPVVNKDSWAWTKKAIVMLGDPMTVFWRDKIEPFKAEIEPEVEENEGVKTVSLHFTPDLEGVSLRIFANGKLYDVPYVMYETIKINLDPSVEKITVGIKAEDSQYFFKEFDI